MCHYDSLKEHLTENEKSLEAAWHHLFSAHGRACVRVIVKVPGNGKPICLPGIGEAGRRFIDKV